MRKILVLYATLTGNTQMAAMQLADSLGGENDGVDMVELSSLKKFDLVILGVSTWGEGDFNPATEDFLNKIKAENFRLDGVKMAMFGLGDKSYANFCGAVDKVALEMKNIGAELLGEIHKIDGFVDEDKQNELEEWAKKI